MSKETDKFALPCIMNRKTKVFHPKAIGQRSGKCKITEIDIENRKPFASGYAAQEAGGRACKNDYPSEDNEL